MLGHLHVALRRRTGEQGHGQPGRHFGIMACVTQTPGRSASHIAFVDGNFDSVYGGQRRMLVLASALTHRYRVSVVTTRAGRLAEASRSAGVRVAILPAHAAINRFGGAIARSGLVDRCLLGGHVVGWTARFAWWARAHDVRAVVANDLRSCLMCGLGARAIHVPVIWSVRDDARNDRFHGLAARLATAVVTVSDATRGVFDDRERGRLGTRLRTIHNGLPFPPTASWDSSSLRTLLSDRVTPTTPTIALVGMVTPRKGQQEAVLAVNRLRNEHGINAHLAIIGDAPAGYHGYVEQVRQTIEGLGLESSVSWLGFRADAIELMAGADLVILPSRNEGLPGALIEALSVGTPVVTYACSGSDEIVRDGVTGSIVPVGDHAALADAIAEWLAQPDRRARAAEIGAQDMRRRFSIEAYAQAYGTLIENVIRKVPSRLGEAA